MADLSKIKPLQRENLPEIVFDRLCHLILEGGIEPGQALTVASLSDALNVSPMPIREAMARLSHTGAFAKMNGRSLGVPLLSADQLIQLRDIRIRLETMATEQAVGNVDAAFIDRLEGLMGKMIAAEQARDNNRFINVNYQFHFTIYEQSNNAELLEIIKGLWLRVSPHFHLSNSRGHLKVSNEIHRRLLDAIREGRAEDAADHIASDIKRANDQIIACLHG